jgi:hypothetical protein
MKKRNVRGNKPALQISIVIMMTHQLGHASVREL